MDNRVGHEGPGACFVMMPISDPPGYAKGHFGTVYEHLIKPSCITAGFEPFRADQAAGTGVIILDVLRRLISCPMAVCDLSSRNPNVMYELGIRQAFDLPVALLRDSRTARVFDVQWLRDTEYDVSLRVDGIADVRDRLQEAIQETYRDRDQVVNSVVKLLAVEAAILPGTVTLSAESDLILGALTGAGHRISQLDARLSAAMEAWGLPDPPGTGDLTLRKVRWKWGSVLEATRERRSTVGAFLAEGRPTALRGGVLTVAFPVTKAFYANQVRRNRDTVEAAIAEVLGCRAVVVCELEEAPGEAPKSGSEADA